MYHYYDLLFKEIFGTQKNIIYLEALLEDLKELYVYINTNLENIVQNKQSELDDVKSRIKDKISNLKNKK